VINHRAEAERLLTEGAEHARRGDMQQNLQAAQIHAILALADVLSPRSGCSHGFHYPVSCPRCVGEWHGDEIDALIDARERPPAKGQRA
jgi:hypothetical protein